MITRHSKIITALLAHVSYLCCAAYLVFQELKLDINPCTVAFILAVFDFNNCLMAIFD